jgi:K+-transporting ATPase KdpF subunit
MNAKAFLFLIITKTNLSTGYVIGAAIALFIFGYLIYALIKPEKF